MHRARAIFEEEFHAFSLKISGIVTTMYLKSFVVKKMNKIMVVINCENLTHEKYSQHILTRL